MSRRVIFLLFLLFSLQLFSAENINKTVGQFIDHEEKFVEPKPDIFSYFKQNKTKRPWFAFPTPPPTSGSHCKLKIMKLNPWIKSLPLTTPSREPSPCIATKTDNLSRSGKVGVMCRSTKDKIKVIFPTLK